MQKYHPISLLLLHFGVGDISSRCVSTRIDSTRPTVCPVKSQIYYIIYANAPRYIYIRALACTAALKSRGATKKVRMQVRKIGCAAKMWMFYDCMAACMLCIILIGNGIRILIERLGVCCRRRHMNDLHFMRACRNLFL